MKSQLHGAGLLLLGVMGALVTVPAARADVKSPGAEAVSALLDEAKQEAFDLKEDAIHMESQVRSGHSWDGHGAAASFVREHINKSGKLLAQMEASRSSASPVQVEAIDHITPLLKKLADNTAEFIGFVNERSMHIKSAELRDSANLNVQLATELANLISNFVDYERSMEKQQELRSALDQR
jgi:hypothetical protein